jgi:tetratricopeptide (TPR) repeat protein
MSTFFRKIPRLCFLCAALLWAAVGTLKAQQNGTEKLPLVSGIACDSESHPLANVEVILERSDSQKTLKSVTDARGQFQFAGVPAGIYTLHAKRDGYNAGREGPFVLHEREEKSLTVHLTRTAPSSSSDSSAAMPFSDEPQFTVAGVTDTSALGVHASSRSMPSSNALAKDTAALAHGDTPNAAPRSGEPAPSTQEASLRAQLATAETANLRFQLAEIEEKKDRPLEAQKDYQRAAELAPTEEHLFGWGAELLLHRAFEPAIEVFGKGHHCYPASVRMLLGLGAANYAKGSREQAAQYFLQASDLDPADPQPYVFLGTLLATENVTPTGWTYRFERFAVLHHENAKAHYLYGLALAKSGEQRSAAEAESELKLAIDLDPHLGNAYLELGILRSEHKNFVGAITALQKAIENTPLPDEAHYRLADVYRRTREPEKARQETALYKKISEEKSQQAERERHEIQQFVYTLRGQSSSPQPSTPDPATH